MPYLLVCVLILGTLAAQMWPMHVRAPVVTDFTAIDAYVQAEMARAPIPGLALGIVHGKQIVHLKGFGVAGPSGRAVTPQTPFILGSISKTFTALAIQQLAEAGKVDLDVPVQRYIPWFRVADAAATKQITVRHLLDHTSGIPRNPGQTAALLDPHYSLEQIVRDLGSIQLNRPVGRNVEYSNLNYLVLGLIVEMVAAQPYGEYVQQHIFAPLQMQHSYTSEADGQRDGLATGYHMWYGFAAPAPLPYLHEQLCEGYLISTAEDMSHYMVAYLSQGRYADAQVLPPATSGWYDEYWNTRTESPVNLRVGQSGGTIHFSGQMWLVPAPRWGVIVLMNTQPDAIMASSVSAESIATGVAMMLQGWQAGTPSGLGFGLTYALIDVVLLGLVMYTLMEVVLLHRWQRTSSTTSRRWRSALIDCALALFLLISLPLAFGRAWDYWLLVLPDIAGVLYCTSLALLAVGAVKTGIILFASSGSAIQMATGTSR